MSREHAALDELELEGRDVDHHVALAERLGEPAPALEVELHLPPADRRRDVERGERLLTDHTGDLETVALLESGYRGGERVGRKVRRRIRRPAGQRIERGSESEPSLELRTCRLSFRRIRCVSARRPGKLRPSAVALDLAQPAERLLQPPETRLAWRERVERRLHLPAACGFDQARAQIDFARLGVPGDSRASSIHPPAEQVARIAEERA